MSDNWTSRFDGSTLVIEIDGANVISPAGTPLKPDASGKVKPRKNHLVATSRGWTRLAGGFNVSLNVSKTPEDAALPST